MSHTLNIHRWCNDILVPRQCGNMEKLRADLEDVSGKLQDDLRADLLPWISGQGDEVVLIRSITFDCELDVSRAPDLLSARWAGAFARSLIDAVEGGGAQVLRFASEAHYRARFIADTAAGTAATAWYYRAFSGLAALPAAAALRTLLLEDVALGRDTLALLNHDSWRRLDGVLTQREALRILEGLTAAEHDAVPKPADLIALYRECAPKLSALSWPVGALYCFTQARHAGLHCGTATADFARLAARLATLAAGDDEGALSPALRHLDFPVLATLGDDAWQELAAHPQWGPLFADLTGGATSLMAPSKDAAPREAHTAFAGLSLLLPALDELLGDELLADTLSAQLPPCEFAAPRAVAAWLALSRCAGASRARQFVAEPFWRDWFGIHADTDRNRLRHWLEGGDADTTVHALARSVRHKARGDVLTVPLPPAGSGSGTGDRILVDRATALWCGPFEAATEQPDRSPVTWRARLAATRTAHADWRFLTLDWGLPDAWQRLFTQLAQAALRSFAWRIPGFGGASLPWLQANLLSGTGNLDFQGILRLQRPPLHVMLNLTGIGRGDVHWRGPPPRTLRLEYTA